LVFPAAAHHTNRFTFYWLPSKDKKKVSLKINKLHVFLVRKRTIPPERQSLVGEISVNISGYMNVAWSAQRVSAAVNFGFLDLSRYFSFKLFSTFLHNAKWTPFQIYNSENLAENLVALGIDIGISRSVARYSDH
jgi:hypothetical protein